MTAFPHHLTEKHDVSDTEFFTDAGGYLATLARLDLRGELNYSERNLVEKWFHTVTMRIGRFHSFWWGSPASTRRWLRRFRHHYNHDRPRSARWTNANRGGSRLDAAPGSFVL
jgi:putative transposase